MGDEERRKKRKEKKETKEMRRKQKDLTGVTSTKVMQEFFLFLFSSHTLTM